MNRLRDILSNAIPVGGSWLFVLRAGVSVALIAKILCEFRFIDMLYGSNGFVPLRMSFFSQNSFIPSLQDVYRHMGAFSTESHFLTLFFLCQLIFAAFLLFGLFTRFSAFMCWLMQVIIFNSSHLTSYGFDAVLLSLLFYSMIFPLTPKSLKGDFNNIQMPLLKPPSGGLGVTTTTSDNPLTPLYLKIIQLHICLIYFVNGISKISGHTWHDGSGIWDAINQPQFQSCLTPLLLKLLMIGHMPAVVTWSTIIIELTYPFLIWVRGINSIILSLIILLHVFIALVFGLWLFAFVMIIFNLAAFGDIYWQKENALQ